MHYKNGKPVQLGDKVMGMDCGGNPISGVIVEANAGSTTCNLRIVPTNILMNHAAYCTASDCLLASDAMEVRPPSEPEKS